MRKNLPVTGKEVLFNDDDKIISTTNTKGVITSVNEAFLKISGFTKEELIGQAHNIVRHPDMPQAAYTDLWSTLKKNQPWMGLVKNRCKNGDHYWVNAYVMAVYSNGVLTGYQSVRTKPERRYVEAAETLYSRLQQNKRPTALFNAKFRQLVVNLLSVAIPVAAVTLAGGASWLGIAAGAATGIIAAFTLYSWQQKSLQSLQEQAQKIHDSDLASQAFCGDTSPASRIEVALQAQKSQQVTLLELLQHSASNLTGVIQDTNSIMQKNNQGVNQQNVEIAQLATAITQMTTAIDDVAKNAAVTSASAKDASNEVDDGKSIIDQTKSAITQLTSEIGSANQLILQLEKDANAINNIISVINGITFQTNLLALNASVEAARAGESGRGFSVVAEEVRSLATNTQTSTTEIEKMIKSLQNHTQQAVDVMEVSATQATRTAEDAEGVTKALNSIAETVALVNDMNTEIATATEQQSAVTKEINRSISNIHNAANDMTQAAQGSAEACHKLEAVAEEIESVVKQFRL
ncbi:MAG: PAS domain-containing methyl-accepting chemotaxis protein [Pseudomonadales bacterium]